MRLKLYFLFISFIVTNSTLAQVPGTLSYQGILTDASGNPLSGSHSVLFNFYTRSAPTTIAFARGPLTVTTFQGLFTVILGNGQGSNNAGLPNLGSTQYDIGIVADGGTELSPRVALTAVPYAFTASALDPSATIGGNQINSPITKASVTLPAAQVTGTITNTQLATGIDAAKITTGTMSGARVGAGINASNITVGTLPASVIPAAVGAPIGSITAFAGPLAKIPTGWLECDGSSLLISAYPSLYAAIGNIWGSADGTHFNIPFLLGYFLRGWSHGSGVDPDAASRVAQGNPGSTGSGDNVGSFQSDQFRSHSHSMLDAWGFSAAGGSNNGPTNGALRSVTSTNASGGNETRPLNAYVIYIIKAQ